MASELLIESGYTLVILLCCIYIVYKAARFYILSMHQGIRSFRNAFFFFSCAFLLRYMVILGFGLGLIDAGSIGAKAILVLFNYALGMGGFSLVYSLVWKDMRESQEYLLHLLAFVIAVLEVFTLENTLFVVQIAIFLYAVTVSYSKYKKAPEGSFMQIYFICLILALIGFVLNFAVVFIPMLDIYVKAVTAFVFVVFSYGVAKVAWQRKESV